MDQQKILEESIMKKLLTTVGLLAIMSWAAYPASAERYEGYRMGPEMMGQGYGERYRSSADEGKLKAYDEEMEKHYKSTASQRQEILVKQHEMATLLINTKTTKDELMEKQKELQGLMNTLQREELSFRWDIHKKYPEMSPDVYGGCLEPAAGSGGAMMGYGGAGMMGYGYYGHGMMDSDDYDEHGRGMMGSGWGNWRRWWPWRDKAK
jgi:hypothetical protein